MSRNILNATWMVLCFVGYLNSPVSAALISNPSFESPAQADGTFSENQTGSTDAITDWDEDVSSSAGSVGVLNPNSAVFSGGSVPAPGAGDQAGFLVLFNGNGGSLSIGQTTGATFAANTTYTLSLAVGARMDVEWPFAGYRISLIDATNLTELAFEQDELTPVAGTFELVDVSYTTGAAGAELGQPIRIAIRTTIPQTTGPFLETFVDNATLTAVPVPEPSSLALLALGGLFMWFFKGKRRLNR